MHMWAGYVRVGGADFFFFVPKHREKGQYYQSIIIKHIHVVFSTLIGQTTILKRFRFL